MANILVVDDEESIGEVVELNLTLEGHRVKRFTSAEKAMEEFNRPGVKFDIAILDIMLPGISGTSLCEYIRARDSDIGIIMLSAKSQEKDKVHSLSVGGGRLCDKALWRCGLVARLFPFAPSKKDGQDR